MNRHPQPASERGMALIVGLILLALMTVMTLTSFNIGRTSMDVVSNLQRHNEVVTAANSAIEEAISSTRLFQSPNTLFLTPCNNQANTRCYDVNEDGTDDITVVLAPAPTCQQSQVIPTTNLNYDNLADRQCLVDSSDPNYTDSLKGDSLCANTIWELRATATDLVTEASVTVTEGTAVRILTKFLTSSC